jgi:hypothetical protein
VSGTWVRGVAQVCTMVACAAATARCVALAAGGSRAGSGWRVKVGKAGARAGSSGARTEATRARAQRGAGVAEAVHLAGQWRRRAAEEKQRRWRER